jgi:hypothetical protein
LRWDSHASPIRVSGLRPAALQRLGQLGVQSPT